MLLQFSVSNFRSFRELQELSLAGAVQDKSLPANCINLKLPGVSNNLWLKGIAIYGANASGKSTVMEALKALSLMVRNSARSVDPKDEIEQVEPYALDSSGTKAEPTAWDIVFVVDGIRFNYRVAATRDRIWHESLRAYPTAKAQTWFNRDWNPETGSYEWGPERPTGFPRDTRLEGDTLSNVLFLSKHVASNRIELEPIFRWFKEKLQFIHLDANWNFGADFTIGQVQEKTDLYKRILNLLKHADLGVTDARIIDESPPKELVEALREMPSSVRARIKDTQFVSPELTHRGANGESYPLPWEKESTGTHRLFALAGPWLDILSNGHVVCIDELDTSMHPLMVAELLQLLFCDKENANQAQVIFTTHNPLLLDLTLLRRDQVWFTEKDAQGQGHLYPLTDYNPRTDESLIRGYLSGRYGALPFLPQGLLGQKPSYKVLPPVKSTLN